MQVPAAPQLTFMQQVMPYLVMFVIGLLGALGLVVKAYAEKLIKQMQINKTATDDANNSAQAAAHLAASSVIAVASHNKQATAKLDTIIEQTNGINNALTAQVAAQQKQITDLTNGKA